MNQAQPFSDGALRVGVSSCLLGQKVRFDTGHKRDRFLTDCLDEFVEWVPVCPEVEAGFGLPRPSMRLVKEGDRVALLETQSGADHTRQMQRYAAKRVKALRGLELCGYVLKRDSPSCGMERVKVYGQKGGAKRDGRGLFAAALVDTLPDLPVEEEGRLNDARLRENFIERIFAYRRLRNLFRGRWTTGRVVEFHTMHKLQLMAHSPAEYRELGRMVANVKKAPRNDFRRCYSMRFMAACSRLATRGRNTNVLEHAAGHLKNDLDAAGRAELSQVIQEYRTGFVPIVVPLTLVHHHVRRLDVAYLQGQTFLEPHPKELMLRNHV